MGKKTVLGLVAGCGAILVAYVVAVAVTAKSRSAAAARIIPPERVTLHDRLHAGGSD